MKKYWCKILGLLALVLTLLLSVSGSVNALVPELTKLITQADCCPVEINAPGFYLTDGPLTVGDANTPAVRIRANDVWFSCAEGVTITGPNGTSAASIGILVEGSSSVPLTLVTVEDCTVSNFTEGIGLRWSNGGSFTRNRVVNNTADGFDVQNSNENFFIQNTVNRNGQDGFDLDDSDANVFTANTANNNGQDGINLNESEGNFFVSNDANNNRRDGFRIENMSNQNTFIANFACPNGSFNFRQIDSTAKVIALNSNVFCPPSTPYE